MIGECGAGTVGNEALATTPIVGLYPHIRRKAAAYLQKTGLRPRRLATIRAWLRQHRK